MIVEVTLSKRKRRVASFFEFLSDAANQDCRTMGNGSLVLDDLVGAVVAE